MAVLISVDHRKVCEDWLWCWWLLPRPRSPGDGKCVVTEMNTFCVHIVTRRALVGGADHRPRTEEHLWSRWNTYVCDYNAAQKKKNIPDHSWSL